MIRELWSTFWTLVGGALTLNGQVLLVARDAPRAGLRWMLDLPVLQAFLAAGLGWLLQAFLGGLLERPLAGVRGWMWRTASGREVFVRSPDILVELPRDGGAPGTAPTDRPGGSGTVQHGE